MSSVEQLKVTVEIRRNAPDIAPVAGADKAVQLHSLPEHAGKKVLAKVAGHGVNHIEYATIEDIYAGVDCVGIDAVPGGFFDKLRNAPLFVRERHAVFQRFFDTVEKQRCVRAALAVVCNRCV